MNASHLTSRGGLLGRIKALLALVGAVWVVSITNLALGGSLNSLAIQPRSIAGLPGIVAAPFLHGGLGHLACNTAPLLFLGALVSLRGVATFWLTTAMVIAIGGLSVWLLGRNALHLGASGLVFGYFGYLVARGWFERRPGAIALAVITVCLYSGLVWGILPVSQTVSWEGHLFGMLAGGLTAYLQVAMATRRTT